MRNKAIITVIFILILSFLVGCGSDDPFDDPLQSEPAHTTKAPVSNENPTDPTLLYLVEKGVALPIICSEDADNEIIAIGERLKTSISICTGVTPRFTRDYITEMAELNRQEIVIGVTNRPESVELGDSLDELTFSVTVTENKVIIVGTSVQLLSDAVDYFIENYVESKTAIAKQGELAVKKNTSYISEQADPTFRNLMEQNLYFQIVEQSMFTFDKDGNFRVFSSACSDGKYCYVLMRGATPDSDNGRYRGVIYKISLDTGAVIRTGQPFITDMGSDMTYDNTSSMLYVINGEPDASRVTIVNSGDLSVSSTLTAALPLGALCGIKGGGYIGFEKNSGDFLVLDADLKVTRREKTDIAPKSIKSCCFDGRYVYLLSEGTTLNPNSSVTVFTQSGAEVNSIRLDFTARDAQSIDIMDGNLIVGFRDALWSSGEIFKISIARD
jgi:hypothetical protein